MKTHLFIVFKLPPMMFSHFTTVTAGDCESRGRALDKRVCEIDMRVAVEGIIGEKMHTIMAKWGTLGSLSLKMVE